MNLRDSYIASHGAVHIISDLLSGVGIKVKASGDHKGSDFECGRVESPNKPQPEEALGNSGYFIRRNFTPSQFRDNGWRRQARFHTFIIRSLFIIANGAKVPCH